MFGGFRILFILITTKCIISEGGEVDHIRVNGLINQPILLSLDMDPLRHVDQFLWNFQNKIMASYSNSQLKVFKKEFKGRVEILDNGGALRIGQLRLEDSGLYTGTITFTDETTHISSYNLSVYEPVPAPTMKIAQKTNDKGCNVTINCSVPTNPSNLSYSLKYRQGNSDYQSYDKLGDAIEMSLPSESHDMEVICIVKNPADQKNVYAHITCLDSRGWNNKTGKASRYYYYAFLALFLIPLIFLGWYCLEMKKKRRKELKITHEEEIHYADLNLGATDAPIQVKKEDRNPPEEPSECTVYSTLRHDKD